MTKKINIVENGQSFDFELDENGYIWLLNNEFEGSKINIGQVSGNIRQSRRVVVKSVTSYRVYDKLVEDC